MAEAAFSEGEWESADGLTLHYRDYPGRAGRPLFNRRLDATPIWASTGSGSTSRRISLTISSGIFGLLS